ncbi:hypothetical protein J6590_013644 [Homalodisca vitripennis]|nr:hypothetical protein J6590_013644 [Homalodisca vitripennis]
MKPHYTRGCAEVNAASHVKGIRNSTGSQLCVWPSPRALTAPSVLVHVGGSERKLSLKIV